MGKRGPKPKGKVSTEWSRELAYAVGLITTDGSLSKDGRHLGLTSKDRQQVVNFRNCLGLSHIKIGRKASGTNEHKDYLTIQFGDVLFYQWLEKIGLTPNKSKTLGPLKIPDKYFFDFLRGCFDGDGTIYAYWDPRWHSSYMFYICFASASPRFLEWVQATVEHLSGVRGKIGAMGSARVQQLRFAKRETKILWERMYRSANVPCLHRKFVKAQKIFTIEANHNNLPGW